jgi:hypothetical protein
MQPGSLVLCIQNHEMKGSNLTLLNAGYVFPTKDNIYVVRGDNGQGGIWLEEITNPFVNYVNGGKIEVAFGKWAFSEIQPPMNINLQEFIKEIV